ncbi:ATP-binding cassette domain-containing protein, partial [Coprococcus comes]|uniref:ATP-binding cassette domain-containing protein n=1 Tax=Coprococcus comes TaxID=410072 RepID=UPI001FAC4CE9
MFLEIKGIKKSFGTGDSRVNVLKGFDLEIERGEFCVLLGPSGSGKSTLLNIIGGIDGADEGSITIDGEQLEDMTEKKLSLYRRKHLEFPIVKDTTPNMMNPRLYTTSYNKP